MPLYTCIATGNKTTAGGIKDMFGLNKVFDLSAFNDFWIAGRSILDSVAGAAGIPLANLRQQYRTKGVDPAKVETYASATLKQNQGAGDLTPDMVNYALDTGEQAGKFNISMLGIAGVLLAVFVAFGLRAGRRRGWFKRFRRPRINFRRFRMFRRRR